MGSMSPGVMLQKAQLRVQMLPMIRKVATFLEKHSHLLGHLALWQTVFRCRSSMRPEVQEKFSLLGSLIRSHGGIRKGFSELLGKDMLGFLDGDVASGLCGERGRSRSLDAAQGDHFE